MAGRTSLNGARILLVDDDPDTRMMYDFGLGSLGGLVVAVPSSDEALEAFRRERPDVFVSDITLEASDGFGLLRAVRALDDAGAMVPAIALSGWTGDSARERAFAAGFDEYCTKPCTPDELGLVVARLLRDECRATRRMARQVTREAREAVVQSKAHRRKIRKEAELRRRKDGSSG